MYSLAVHSMHREKIPEGSNICNFATSLIKFTISKWSIRLQNGSKLASLTQLYERKHLGFPICGSADQKAIRTKGYSYQKAIRSQAFWMPHRKNVSRRSHNRFLSPRQYPFRDQKRPLFLICNRLRGCRRSHITDSKAKGRCPSHSSAKGPHRPAS